MPSYNAENYVEQAVLSVMGQEEVDIELIIVDDGSEDGTYSILTKLSDQFGQKITLKRQTNRGPYPARNFGLTLAKGELVAFLDADDYWAPGTLAKLENALEDRESDIAYCGWQNFGVNSFSSNPYVPPEYDSGNVVKEFLKACPWPIHAALVRRAALQRVGGFSERYRTSMDYDLWLRLLALKPRIVRVPEVLAYYRWHVDGQISDNRAEQSLSSWRVRKDFVNSHPELLEGVSKSDVMGIINDFLRGAAFRAYWARDLEAAHILLRQILKERGWRKGDARYMLPVLLPLPIYSRVVELVDRKGVKHE